MVFGIDAYATSSIPLTRSLTFPNHNVNKYSAIITGAHSATMHVLSQSPPRQTCSIWRSTFLNSEPKDVATVLQENNVVASMH